MVVEIVVLGAWEVSSAAAVGRLSFRSLVKMKTLRDLLREFGCSRSVSIERKARIRLCDYFDKTVAPGHWEWADNDPELPNVKRILQDLRRSN